MSAEPLRIPKIAFLGGAGSFSEQACRVYMPDAAPQACGSFSAVADSVRVSRAAYGILPIHNSIIGAIPQAIEFAGRPEFEIVKTVNLEIDLRLLARAGTSLDEIGTLVSCAPAFDQCSRFLAQRDWSLLRCASTSDAASLVAHSDQALAAIAGALAAETYGLDTLLSGIQDRADNVTSFAIIAARTSKLDRRRPEQE